MRRIRNIGLALHKQIALMMMMMMVTIKIVIKIVTYKISKSQVYSSMVQYLPSKYMVPSSISSTLSQSIRARSQYEYNLQQDVVAHCYNLSTKGRKLWQVGDKFKSHLGSLRET